MNQSKIFLILSILGIFLLIFLTRTTKDQTGVIESIMYSENKITIILENQNETLILFNPTSFRFKIGDKISYQGKVETYRGQKQIIVDRITKET